MKITIRGSRPPIWRRVIVPEKITFNQLHRTIQRAFGWDGFHLHKFKFPAAAVCVVDAESWDDSLGMLDSWEYLGGNELNDYMVVEYPKRFLHGGKIQGGQYARGLPLVSEAEQSAFSEILQTIWNQTRMIDNYGFTSEELGPFAPQPDWMISVCAEES